MQTVSFEFVLEKKLEDILGLVMYVGDKKYYVHTNENKFPGLREGDFPVEIDQDGKEIETILRPGHVITWPLCRS